MAMFSYTPSHVLQEKFQRLQLSSVRNHPLFTNVADMPKNESNLI